jgi:hypothetical protein
MILPAGCWSAQTPKEPAAGAAAAAGTVFFVRVLTKRGLNAHAASFDLPSRLIACSSGRSQSQ